MLPASNALRSHMRGGARSMMMRAPARRVPIFCADQSSQKIEEKEPDPLYGSPMYKSVRDELDSMPGFLVAASTPTTVENLQQLKLQSLKGYLPAPEGSVDLTPTRWTDKQLKGHLLVVGGALQAIKMLKAGEHIAGNLLNAPTTMSLEDGAPDDLAIACAFASKTGLYKRILVCDLGSDSPIAVKRIAKDLENISDGRIYTFSMQAEGAPRESSPWDFAIECKPGTPDRDYLDALRATFTQVIDTVKPDLIVYRPGVESMLSIRTTLSLSRQSMQERNLFVFEAAISRKIPVLISAKGGMVDSSFPLVDAHQLQVLSESRLDIFRGALQTVVINSHRQLYF